MKLRGPRFENASACFSGYRWSRIGWWILTMVGSVCAEIGSVAQTSPVVETNKPTVIVVVGAPGEESYREKFEAWAGKWMDAVKKGEGIGVLIGGEAQTATNSLTRLKEVLDAEPKESVSPLWLILIGHGTFDGKAAKFNLSGADLSSEQLAQWIQPFQRRLAIVNCASASGPFLRALSASNRVVIVATKNGSEQNFARYGEFLSDSIGDPESDLDKDGQVSLLEAHLAGAKKTADFYQQEGRLATEHSLIDDNGDGLGTPSDWFQGVRATKKAKDGAEADGLRANQLCLIPSDEERRLSPEIRQRRDALELQLELFKEKKASMPEADYYKELQTRMLELAHLYQQAGMKPKTSTP